MIKKFTWKKYEKFINLVSLVIFARQFTKILKRKYETARHCSNFGKTHTLNFCNFLCQTIDKHNARKFLYGNDDLAHYTSWEYYCTLPIFTAWKRSLRRLCFHRCVSIHRGGVCGRGHAWQGVCMAGGVHGRGLHGGRHVWQGACVAGGMHGRYVHSGGHAWQGVCEGGVHGGEGAYVADTTRYGQWAGGTHPTGMHSC